MTWSSELCMHAYMRINLCTNDIIHTWTPLYTHMNSSIYTHYLQLSKPIPLCLCYCRTIQGGRGYIPAKMCSSINRRHTVHVCMCLCMYVFQYKLCMCVAICMCCCVSMLVYTQQLLYYYFHLHNDCLYFFLDLKISSSNSGPKMHRFGLCSQRFV
jgi:hypothetical protein